MDETIAISEARFRRKVRKGLLVDYGEDCVEGFDALQSAGAFLGDVDTIKEEQETEILARGGYGDSNSDKDELYLEDLYQAEDDEEFHGIE